MRKRLVAIAIAGLLVAGLTGTTWWLASQARTPEHRALSAQPPPESIITATVVAGPLVEDLELTATLTREHTTAVLPPPDAAGAVVTHLPLEPGDAIDLGTVVAELSGRPLIALPGEFRAYRDLTEGDQGRDVRQLQEALRPRYGNPVTGHFDSSTAQAVRALYRDAGYPVIEEPAEPVPGDPDEDPAQEPPEPALLVVVPAAELLHLHDLPATIGQLLVDVGDDIAAEPLATVVAGGWQAAATLATPVQIPAEAVAAGSGIEAVYQDTTTTVDGDATVTTAYFQLTSEPPDGATPGTTIELVVELRRSADDALLVPATALWTVADGTTLVTVHDEHGDRDVPVEIDVSHHGLAAVLPEEPGALQPGDKVLVGWRQ